VIHPPVIAMPPAKVEVEVFIEASDATVVVPLSELKQIMLSRLSLLRLS